MGFLTLPGSGLCCSKGHTQVWAGSWTLIMSVFVMDTAVVLRAPDCGATCLDKWHSAG